MESVILLIDDETTLLHGMNCILKKADYTPHTVCTEIEGLRLAYTLQPDIVILDVNLPDMDGKEVCRQAKHQVLIECRMSY